MSAYNTYAVAITAGGVTYNFHLDSKDRVRELFAGSTQVTAMTIWEQTYRTNERPLMRLMSEAEVNDIIWGRTAGAVLVHAVQVA